jgi:hypothetical protein
MPVSQNTLRFAKILYWLLMSVMVLYVTYLLITSNRSVAAILWLVFGFMLVYIVYPYYFPPGTGAGQWPPYITVCPDYLTLTGTTDCMDFVGAGSTTLKKANRANPPRATDPDYSQYVFNNTGSLADKASKARQYGLSWLGIT